MAEQIPCQPQKIPDSPVQQGCAVGEQGVHIFLKQRTHAHRGMTGQIQQPPLNQADAGLGGLLQVRKHPCQSSQLPNQEGAQQKQQHGHNAKGHTHPDPGTDSPGDAAVFLQGGDQWLRCQRQKGSQQEGRKQGQQVAQGKPDDEKHRQKRQNFFDSG